MAATVPSFGKMLRRALVLKCPHCGRRPSTMRRWLGHRERCASCGIEWHREHGFELGGIALNVVLTFFVLGVGMAAAFVATAPDIPVLPLTVGFVAGAVLVPLIAYPFTFLVWQAFDLTMNKPDSAELERAAAALSEGLSNG